MRNFKKSLMFVLCLLPIAIIAGIFVSLYQLDIYTPEVLEMIVAQVGSTDMLIVVGVVQTVGYGLVLGFIGHILANKIGLWKTVKIEKKALITTLIISIIGGALFSLDHWTFGSMIDGIQAANIASLTFNGVIASILYGGIIYAMMGHALFHIVCKLIWIIFI